MTDTPSDEQDEAEAAPKPNFFVERSPILLGAVGAVIALVAPVGLPWEFHVIANAALAWFSLALAVLAMVSLERGRRNRWSIVALVVGILAFVFWSGAPEIFGELPVYVYLLTALVQLALGLLIGRMDRSRQRSVLIAAAGAVVFTIVTSASRLGL